MKYFFSSQQQLKLLKDRPLDFPNIVFIDDSDAEDNEDDEDEAVHEAASMMTSLVIDLNQRLNKDNYILLPANQS